MVRSQGVGPMTDSITIGRLAQAAAVNVETIRYYQRRGLVSEPVKPLGGQRRYPPEAVKRVRFIKRAQNLGFTLDEVRGLLALDDGQSCRDTRRLAEKKLAVIETRLADLARLRKLLKGLIAECESGKRHRRCPITATLSAGAGVTGSGRQDHIEESNMTSSAKVDRAELETKVQDMYRAV